MKVTGVYDKDSNLKCFNKNIFKMMKEYLKKYPEEYRKNYVTNLQSLKLLKVDRVIDDVSTGRYNKDKNVILFVDNNSLGHELFHMASNDLNSHRFAIEEPIDIEQGLIEGMTEYLFMDAYNLPRPLSYGFEVFCVQMLADIPDLFKPYFIPSHDDFINLFKNKKHIYSLLYALSIYNDKMIDFFLDFDNEEDNPEDMDILKEAVRSVIDNLINIQLSNKENMSEYADKFMDLISSSSVRGTLCWVYDDYINYADKEIYKRIKCKR